MQNANTGCAVTQSGSTGLKPGAEILEASLPDSSEARDGKRCLGRGVRRQFLVEV